ncbi:DUF5667 domain-containing protein [Patescibacteria group bacterium]
MNKIKLVFLVFSALIISLFSKSYVFALDEEVKDTQDIVVNSYEMFWPIVAGKVQGDSLYGLKLFKEKVREILIFSNFKKADYNITISEKRIVEAEKLINESRFEDAEKTLNRLNSSLSKVVNNIDLAEKSGIPVESLEERFNSSLERQSALLSFLEMKLPEENKEILSSITNQINNLLSE